MLLGSFWLEKEQKCNYAFFQNNFTQNFCEIFFDLPQGQFKSSVLGQLQSIGKWAVPMSALLWIIIYDAFKMRYNLIQNTLYIIYVWTVSIIMWFTKWPTNVLSYDTSKCVSRDDIKKFMWSYQCVNESISARILAMGDCEAGCVACEKRRSHKKH